MDYICIGANGFAQVGNENYFEKNRVEMKILMETIQREFPIPQRFEHILNYKVKSFPHDFGTYHEIVLIYNDSILDDKEDTDNPEDQTFIDEFWEFVNKVESFDLESEELTHIIDNEYNKTLPIPDPPKASVIIKSKRKAGNTSLIKPPIHAH